MNMEEKIQLHKSAGEIQRRDNSNQKPSLHKDVEAKVESKKWFYSETVKEHFFKPKNFLLSEEKAREADEKSDGVGQVGSPACGDMMKMWLMIDRESERITDCKWQTFGSVLPGSDILMDDFSIKKIEEILIGDKIIDGIGERNFVEEVLVRDYKGKVVNVQLSTPGFYNMALTPNHPVLCVRRKQVALVNRISGERMSEVSSEKIEDCEAEIVPAGELKRGDFLLYEVPLVEEDVAELDDDMCTLLGYYVSDGCLTSSKAVTFYFGLNEIEYVDEIAGIAKRKGFEFRSFKRRTENVLCVVVKGEGLVNELKRHGGAPSHKGFSSEVMKLPKRKQEKIVESYISGDGWVLQQNPNWQPQYFISTSRARIAYQLQMMIARQGVFAPIHRRGGREFVRAGKKYRNSGEYNLIWRNNVNYSRVWFSPKESAFLIPVSRVDVEDYEGKIYDLGIVYQPKTFRLRGISLHNCASAIASTSMLSVMLTENGGMKIEDALKIKPQNIVVRLDGLPQRKFHCSVLGDKALRAAVNDYFRKTGQESRIVVEGAKVIDKILKITDKDIEEAVLEGAHDFEAVQKKTKVGVYDKNCIPEVEQLIRFYREKYFG